MKTFALASFVLVAALPASAQVSLPTSPLDDIYACAELLSDAERLACFDAKVARTRQAETNREFVAIDANTAREIQKEGFGYDLPSLPRVVAPQSADATAPGDATDGQDTVLLAVDRVTASGRNYVVVMENGQVWRQVGGRINYVPRGDLTAEIRRAALGSYKMSLANGKERVRGLRVRRVK